MKYLFGLGELLSYQVNLISVGVGVTLVFGGLVLFFVFHHIFFVPLQLDFLEADFLVIQIYLCHQHQGLILLLEI